MIMTEIYSIYDIYSYPPPRWRVGRRYINYSTTTSYNHGGGTSYNHGIGTSYNHGYTSRQRTMLCISRGAAAPLRTGPNEIVGIVSQAAAESELAVV